MSDPLLYRLGGRGTGKTTRLVKATPTGGVYIVSSPGMCGVIKGYLQQIGRKDEIDVKSIDDVVKYGCLRGKLQALAIDHTVFDEEIGGMERDELNQYIYRAPLVLTNDYEGDVITSYKESTR